jgi:transcriptional regulator GlxA family with amidase domain
MEKDVGISQIADSLQVSREHLARVFRENAGIPPSEYINQKKMKFACHLLKDTNLSCREVAARVGYGNPNSFTRAFRKIIGFSPSEIKRTGYIPAI